MLVVLPRLDDGRIILMRRLADGQAAAGGTWELPACPLDERTDPAEAAAALLHGTVDFVPGRLLPLGAIGSARCYLAEGLRPSPLPPVHSSRTMTTALPLAEVRELIHRGLIHSAMVESAVALLR